MALFQNRYHGSTVGGDIWIFSWWADSTSALSVVHADAVTWGNEFFNGVGVDDGYATLVTAGVVFNKVTTGEIDVATGQQQTLAETDVSIAGTNVSNPLPADVAIVVSLRTALANRQGRGRFYLPQPAVDQVSTSGEMLASTQNTLSTALTNAWTNFNVSHTPSVYSRGSKFDPTRFSTPITSFNIGSLFDTQRRRENALVETRVSAPMP